MTTKTRRQLPLAGAVGALWLLILLLAAVGSSPAAAESALGPGTIPSVAPVLRNGDMECADGYTEGVNGLGETIHWPDGWMYTARDGSPKVNSARIQFTKACDGQGHVERIGGEDSFVVRAQDLETPPEPGKPFDSVILQQVAVETGGDYSLSGWMLTLCGGSAVPNDCPDGYYMAKMLGLDPAGGRDPDAASVRWVENRANFVTPDDQRIGWANLSVSARAESITMTVFARIQSPFRWHGNHGFIDALSLIRAPVVTLDALPSSVQGNTVDLTWQGEQSPDVELPGATFQLLVDIQARPQSGVWRDVTVGGAGADTARFTAPCFDTTYEFRIRARAEQLEGEGIWPNQRYPGTWSDVQTVHFTVTPTPGDEALPHKQFMPLVRRAGSC